MKHIHYLALAICIKAAVFFSLGCVALILNFTDTVLVFSLYAVWVILWFIIAVKTQKYAKWLYMED